MNGAAQMARPKGQAKRKPEPEPTQAGRVTIINLKGTAEEGAWLEEVHRKTHVPKAVIVRLALAEWAKRNGHPAYPGPESGR